MKSREWVQATKIRVESTLGNINNSSKIILGFKAKLFPKIIKSISWVAELIHYNKSKLYTVNFGIDYKLRLKDKFQLVSILMRAHDFVYEI